MQAEMLCKILYTNMSATCAKHVLLSVKLIDELTPLD